MRITEEAKNQNREKIIKAAAMLFAEKGFEETTTRDIAKAAGLATGTMFNYFPSKETMAMSMINEALLKGGADFVTRRTGEEEFAEELFLFITTGLQRLRAMHPFIGPVLEKSLSPFARKATCKEGESAREQHLAVVSAIMTRHGHTMVPEFLATNIYWSLYLGILAFWSNDDSPNQEATLAMIDYSIILFARMISAADPVAGGLSK
ncbi:MAG: TetR/AcrR family transcriptional regulator [Proteobacteria bacterium]|nr:TetR/AcrR family transcriptional regulator [Pseudomonadota bacterium]MBU1715574.1 TetR/AcrR family transcriptional regulator [Pseudomonadota bacterium]